MKRMIVSVMVEEDAVYELSEKITKLVEEKKGEVGIQVSDVPPKGSGATLAGVA